MQNHNIELLQICKAFERILDNHQDLYGKCPKIIEAKEVLQEIKARIERALYEKN
jgi:hypothetical protein